MDEDQDITETELDEYSERSKYYHIAQDTTPPTTKESELPDIPF